MHHFLFKGYFSPGTSNDESDSLESDGFDSFLSIGIPGDKNQCAVRIINAISTAEIWTTIIEPVYMVNKSKLK